MRTLLPSSSPPAPADLYDHYGDGWLETGGLRVNFVTSVDGAIAASGRSRGLQTAGDNAVFAALRDLADVVVVGAGTARAEGYRAVRFTAARLDRRRAMGLSEQLPIAVVSNSLGLDPSTELFTATQPGARTIVFTCDAAKPTERVDLAEVADLVVCGSDTVDLAAVRRVLVDRGLHRILCEGGPTLFAEFASRGLVDELCLSTAPLLAGPGSGRVVAGPEWVDDPRALELVGLLEDDGALFSRYRVRL